MGIHGLMKVLADEAPQSYKEGEIKNYFGRVVAIDASMSIYQFLIAVRNDGQNLSNEAGETTSHLIGMFYRTIRMIENGIKPVYVFDGKPPPLKSGELKKRLERRQEAEKNIEEQKESGNAEDVEKFVRRTVRVTPEHNNECKKLLRLMGVPYVEAPCEAEAQCAELCRAGKVYGTASEDMDSLTFGTSILLRHMTFSEARKEPIVEINTDRVLQGLGMTQDEFIDLCILLGCDYCESIRGVGPKKAVEFVRKYKTIENILKNLDKTKYPVPEGWNYEGARALFKNPEVTDASTFNFQWDAPDEQGLVDFMVTDKGFNEDRVRNGSKKIAKSRGQATQGRLDSFFGLAPGAMVTPKRKAGDDKGAAAKKGKTGASSASAAGKKPGPKPGMKK